MRKIQYTLCALALAVSAGANADYDGKVNFDGELIDSTCEVASDSKDILVNLPKMQTSLLNGAGKEAGAKTFKINVIKCPAGITKVSAHFDALGNSGWDPKTGNLNNAAPVPAQGSQDPTPATNVQVRLYNTDDNSQIEIGQTGHQFDVDRTTQSASMIYAGGYYATGRATAGPVKAWVQYVVDYH